MLARPLQQLTEVFLQIGRPPLPSIRLGEHLRVRDHLADAVLLQLALDPLDEVIRGKRR